MQLLFGVDFPQVAGHRYWVLKKVEVQWMNHGVLNLLLVLAHCEQVYYMFHLCLLLCVIIALPVSKCALPTGFLVTISYSSALSTLLVQRRFLLLLGFSFSCTCVLGQPAILCYVFASTTKKKLFSFLFLCGFDYVDVILCNRRLLVSAFNF